ncbi:response regulator [Caballeronia sp. LZ032]|uniref:response regulator n=1 Tax=Caballeronia sp. LZ032 TaxID=3038565 RepID=UPI002860892E|nr:response regulator [Caballeronia sp. LZ032]MDR5879919.1 response regulator [Caballeronia sp. LZ032]
MLVNDDAQSAASMRAFLHRHGIELTVATQGNGVEKRIESEHPELVVLDLTMPVIDTLAALRALRGLGAHVPLIVLTAHPRDIDRALELGLGADDYLSKPFSAQQLHARIIALMHGPRATARRVDPFHFGPFTLDFSTRTLLRDQTPLKICGSEYALLVIFTQYPMQALSRARLVELLHGPRATVTERGMDVPVWRLRRLLEENPAVPRRIQTLRGIGYMFVPDEGHWM